MLSQKHRIPKVGNKDENNRRKLTSGSCPATNTSKPKQKDNAKSKIDLNNAGCSLSILEPVKVKSKNLDVMAEYNKFKRKNAANFVVIGSLIYSFEIMIVLTPSQVMSMPAKALSWAAFSSISKLSTNVQWTNIRMRQRGLVKARLHLHGFWIKEQKSELVGSQLISPLTDLRQRRRASQS